MVGTTISHYRVLGELGAGGMGVVYLAEDIRLDRKVALKFLAPDARDEDAAARLRREARSASALDHPNIATVYEVDEWNGRTFVAMAYYAGETLRARLERGPLPSDEIVSILGQIADGLAAAHGAGIMHRDLKPANVLVTSTGQVKILDFGLAKHIATTEDETAAVMTRAGVVLGTLAYMSPEQAKGLPVDARTDIWAWGVLAYELLAGHRPFESQTSAGLAMALASDSPAPIRSVRPDVPDGLERMIATALEKDRTKRVMSAGDIAAALRGLRERSMVSMARTAGRGRTIVRWISATALLAAAVVGWQYWTWRAERHWARTTALAEIARLGDQERYVEAVDLAESVRPHVEPAAFTRILQPITRPATITTTPDGADVWYAEYDSTGPAWRRLGTTPITEVLVPRGLLWWRFEKAGFEPAEDVTGGTIRATLDPIGTRPAGMVRARGPSEVVVFTVQGANLLPLRFADYWIGRHEVSNREFKRFVDAAGYSTSRFWKQAFTRDGKTLTRDDAIAKFVDATGQPGPASWELGRYPAGQDDLPVTGISWYEAAAYAEFAGAELPTLHHWFHVAAHSLLVKAVLPRAVFSRPAAIAVGSSGARHRFGAFDLAGNVKEWSLNASDADQRYVLGGGFDEPAYMFGAADPRSAWERKANIGFRLAKSDGGDTSSVTLRAPVPRLKEPPLPTPVGDDVFAAYARSFSYDRTPLGDVTSQPPDGTPQDWIHETVSFPAPYGRERITVHLMLPKGGRPPYQPVIFVPGGNAWQIKSSQSEIEAPLAAFLVRSGRALVLPILKGTYERTEGGVPDTGFHTNDWRDLVVADGKDLSRTIDYLATRPDLAADKFGYLGHSRGGAFGPVWLALEPRVRAVVFWVPGFHRSRAMPEVHPINFAPRMKQPVLVLNGRYDAIFPEESSQIPFFRSLGTPDHLKHRIVYESGHNLPVNDRIKDTIAWFDRHLGPVR